ncbi:hypothetical protein PPTG_23657 [Phytophthora nicotianae INRA-310]|uniref:Retrotransposon gag domain-containing protein n=1 Tax=Phytophthora nicotianae (strain INRA-310) TaxID=761204 RepID=W2PTH2_PHYN3|nr:hypothetical protein PPTG_23657 [Phytophthora nicotianae INRA-310]ETN04247.1 hypothetical protein PPTG_23657 [Phytophthora nicotianae INRA-310]
MTRVAATGYRGRVINSYGTPRMRDSWDDWQVKSGPEATTQKPATQLQSRPQGTSQEPTEPGNPEDNPYAAATETPAPMSEIAALHAAVRRLAGVVEELKIDVNPRASGKQRRQYATEDQRQTSEDERGREEEWAAQQETLPATTTADDDEACGTPPVDKCDTSSDDEESDSEGRRPRMDRHHRRGDAEADARRWRAARRVIKDLEQPSFTPTTGGSVATWIDRVDLALRGARESGCAELTDRSLYFALGPKLQDSAARWFVNRDRRFASQRSRTWTNLKRMLLGRYASRLDLAAAEWRVNSRKMEAGETYADFAAKLRDAADRKPVSGRVLMAQFYRELDKTTRQLIKQAPEPRDLEEAAEKAAEIDDPADNVAHGMQNTEQPFPAANLPVVQLESANGQVMVVPGVGRVLVSANTRTSRTKDESDDDSEPEAFALFTNPQGAYNKFTGVMEHPPGHSWNGRFWKQKKCGNRRKAAAKKAEPQKPKRR